MSASLAADTVPDAPRGSRHLGLLVLAVLAYVPALASSPGRMPTDTKLYLYLDPGGLISRAASTFESAQYVGWVPHQQIAYLWPSGPWFWAFDVVGVPDWIAHRLWIGTIMFAAGAGVRWAARLVGLAPSGAMAAALVYQLSPFILAYISRTSLLLLPWAAIGWIVGLTVRASAAPERTRAREATGDGAVEATDRRGWRERVDEWRDPALIAMIVATVGAVNATAIALVVPAPLLWLVHTTWQRQIAWRRALGIAVRVGVLSFAVSLWWIGMLVVQSRYGAAVLPFSETLEDVSRNSTGSEVLRGLGYWLFYYRDPVGPTTTASLPYLISVRAIAVSYAVIGIGILGVALVSWTHRRFAALLMAAGAVLAVGVHPIDSPSPLMRLFTSDAGSGLALALRSSTRAVPVFMLGVALAAGALVSALPARRLGASGATRIWLPGWRAVAVVGVGVLALANLPALRDADLVDPAIDRDANPPETWLAAADRVDELTDGTRVLQLPGAEFGAFRWGYTLDQPMVGISDAPLVTRDILPLGSVPAMDLLYALDDRFQEGTIDVAAVAPVARLLGSDVVLLTNDMAFERYRTARPEIVDDILTNASDDGLLVVERIGDPVVNVADVSMIDATSLLDPRVGQPLNPLTVLTVDEGEGVIRAKSDTVVVSGSGDGIVDAAAAGILDGHELLRYSASLAGDDLDQALSEASLLVVTDSNRDRAHHWRGSQDVHGHTEPGGPDDDVLDATDADQRLDPFATTDPATQTVAIQEGPVTAIASSYGEPFAYRPEDRAVMAIDGDLATAWTVGDHGDPIGQRIRLTTVDATIPSDSIVVHQPAPAPGGRAITEVAITVDDEHSFAVELGADSYGPHGQRIVDPALVGATVLELEITEVSVGDVNLAASRSGVGFSEIDLGLEPTTEVIRIPTDALERSADGRLAIVLTRLRVDPTDMWRSDPEAELRRSFTLPAKRDVDVAVTVRLDQQVPDEALAAALYGDGAALAGSRLTGSVAALGAAALDGDPATAWISPFDGAIGATLTFDQDGPITELGLTQPSGDFSPITGVAISDGTQSFEIAVPPPDDDGRSTLPVPAGLAPGELTLTVTAIEPRTTVNRRYGDVMTLPAAIAEIDAAGLVPTPLDPERIVDVECATGLLEIDGRPIGLSFTTTVGSLAAGAPVSATVCGGPLTLAAGEHRIVSMASDELPVTVDRVVLTDDGDAPPEATTAIGVRVDRDDERHRTVTVDPCPDGCWLVFGEGFNDAWSATVDGTDLGPPTLVDGGFNGWWLPPSTASTVVDVRWTAQGPVTWGLIIGVATAIALVAIVLIGRRNRPHTFAPPSLFDGGDGGPPRERTAAAVLIASSAILIAPIWAIVALIPAAFVAFVPIGARPAWLRRPFELTGLVAAASVVIAVLYVERRDRPYPDAGWTLHFDHLNGAALFALLALATGTLFAADATRSR